MLETDPKADKKSEALKLNLENANIKIEAQNKELEKISADLKEKDNIIARLNQQIAVLLVKTAATETSTAPRPMIKIDDLARQLCSTIETLNNEARQKSTVSQPKIVVDQLEVEIKAGIDVQNGIHLTQLQGQELSPQSVSTVKFALRQAPVLKIAED